MYKSLKHQVIEIIEDTYIKKLRNKHIGFMWVNTIDLIQNIMYRYVKIVETDLKEN